MAYFFINVIYFEIPKSSSVSPRGKVSSMRNGQKRKGIEKEGWLKRDGYTLRA